jgi:hypothetical protein
MKKWTLILTILCFAAMGFASGDNDESTHVQSQQQQNQQSQRQAQSAVAMGGSASNGSQQNSQSFALKTPHLAPAVFAPAAYPSAPCRVSLSGGFSFLTGGGAFGGSRMDHECDKRETARSFFDIGQSGAALEILCTTKAAKKAHVAVCQEFNSKLKEIH